MSEQNEQDNTEVEEPTTEEADTATDEDDEDELAEGESAHK